MVIINMNHELAYLLTDEVAVKTAEKIIAEYRLKLRQEERVQKWYEFVKATDLLEKEFIEVLGKLFTGQEKEVLANMDMSPKTYFKAENDDIIASWLFSEKEWQAKFGKASRPTYENIIEKNGSRVIADLPTEVGFDVYNPNVSKFLKTQPIKFAKEVNKTTLEKLAKTMNEGLEAGEKIRDLKDRVKTVFEDANITRTKLIARTETTGAANFGTKEAFKQSGMVEEKEWLAVMDARTRDEHVRMDGEVVKIDETFSNGLDYPGDPSGEPAQICNCRCTMLGGIKG